MTIAPLVTIATPFPLVLALAAAGCTSSAAPQRSLLLTNVVLYDGTGQAPRRGALRIVGDTIAAVGDLTPAPGDSVSDGGGLALAPGFVDTHSHHDAGLSESPEALAAVSQGVTTIVVGQDGGQHLPLAAWFDSLARRPPAVNLASYAGHNTIRGLVLGRDFRRKATRAEVDSMAALLRRELGAGALGLSTGLEYDPGIYSAPEEVVELAGGTSVTFGVRTAGSGRPSTRSSPSRGRPACRCRSATPSWR